MSNDNSNAPPSGQDDVALLRRVYTHGDHGKASLQTVSDSLPASHVTPLLGVHPIVAATLNVTNDQAWEFIETHITGLAIVCYSKNEDIGLWQPCRALTCERYMLDIRESGRRYSWAPQVLNTWNFFRILTFDADRIVSAATAIAAAPAHSLDTARPAGAGATDLRSPQEQRWPWGGHETKLLRDLEAAAAKWWANFDHTDRTTAPTNSDMVSWLVERGVTKRIAEAMATILRLDGLPPGPRA